MSHFPIQSRLKALFALEAEALEIVYSQADREELGRLVDFTAPPQTQASIEADPAVLEDVEVIFSGWGAPHLSKEILEFAPRLQAVFYGAGSIKRMVSEAFWERGILVTSAAAANAVPVAEYALGTILLSLKQFWRYSALTRQGLGWGDHTRFIQGNFRSTVGLISLGMISRNLLELLNAFDLQRIVSCPFLTEAEAEKLRVERRSLTEVFEQSHVVSLHTPQIPETIGMITGDHFARMKEGATFINTARGGVIREPEMIEVLQKRPDLTVILDVCSPEPPAPDSPLLTLPNVILTSHIAGSHGPECQRMGSYMVEEFKRYLQGEPLKWQITRELSARMA